MTETTQTTTADTGSGMSGADLARLMLQRARQDAKKRGDDRPGPARRPKKKASIQYHGRAPSDSSVLFRACWPTGAGTSRPPAAASWTAGPTSPPPSPPPRRPHHRRGL